MTLQQLKALIDSNYPDNTTGQITPARERLVLKAIADFIISNQGEVDQSPFVYDPAFSYAIDTPVIYENDWFLSLEDNNQGNTPASNPTKWDPISAQSDLIRVWSAGVYLATLSMVVYQDMLYILDRDEVGQEPFISSNFTAELAAGQWVQMGVKKNGNDTRTGNLENVGELRARRATSTSPFVSALISLVGDANSVESSKYIHFETDDGDPIFYIRNRGDAYFDNVHAGGSTWVGVRFSKNGDPALEYGRTANQDINLVEGAWKFFKRVTAANRSSVPTELARRDELFLTYPVTINGTGQLDDVPLDPDFGSIKFGADVTTVTGIVPNSDQKRIKIWSLNPNGLFIPGQSTDSIAANRLFSDVWVPKDRPIEIVYDATLSRWVVSHFVEIPDVDALQAFVRGSTKVVYVSDPLRGDLFDYVAESDFVGSADFGTSYPAQDGGYWVRVFKGDVKLTWYPISDDLVANDSPYLQSACDFGREVDINGANIRLGSAIQINNSGLKIFDSKGTGRLVRNNNGMFFLTNGESNLIFENITFEGDTVSDYVVAGIEVLSDSDNVKFKGCTFKKVSQCVFLKNSSNIYVDNCTFIETGYGVLQHNGTISNNVFVTNNFIKDYHLDFVECNSATVETANWVVDGNICEGGSGWPTNFKTEGRFVGLTNISNVVITNNIINKTLGDNAIHIEGICKHAVISNNILDNCVNNKSGESPYITIHGLANDERLKKFIITNNVFKRSDNTLPTVFSFVSGTFSRIGRTVISNNFIESEGNLSGLFFVTNSQQDLLVNANKFINCPDGMEGIGLQRAQLTNNYFIDCALPMNLTQVRNCQISINSFIGTTGDYDIDSNVNSSTSTRPQNNSIVGNFFSKGIRGKDANYNIITNNYFEDGAQNNWGIAGNLVPGYGNIFSNNKYGNESNANEDVVGRYDRRVKIYPGTGPATASGIPVLASAFIEVSTTFAVGDKIMNMNPDSVRAIGWVCTGAGLPGTATWAEFGGVEKSSVSLVDVNRTFILSDKYGYLRFSGATGDLTVPDAVFASGDEIEGEVEGGAKTIIAGAGVTLRYDTNYLPIVSKNGRFNIKFKAANNAVLSGDLLRNPVKFAQTLANEVTVTGATQTTLLNISQGTVSITPDEMVVGSRFEGKMLAKTTWTGGNDYRIWLNLGGLTNFVNVPVVNSGTGLRVEFTFEIVFYGGAISTRNVSFSGHLNYISDNGSYQSIPFLFDRTIDASGNRDVNIEFDGTDATNSMTTIDIVLKKVV